MSGRFGHALKAVALGALIAGSMLGASVGTAAAHDDWRRGDHGRQWYGPGLGGNPHWRGEDPDRRHHRHHRREWREPRVIYAPPPVVYAPSPGFGFSVNIR